MNPKILKLKLKDFKSLSLYLLENGYSDYGIVFYNPSVQIPGFIGQGMCESLNGKSLWFRAYSISSLDLIPFNDHFKLAFIPHSESHGIELLSTDLEKVFVETFNSKIDQNNLTLVVIN